MIIRKSRLFSEEIEYFVNCWGWPIVGDLESGGQTVAEHVGQHFDVN